MSRISEKKRLQMEEMRKHRPDEWQNTKGAPTKEPEVLQYQVEHPNATMYRCSVDTGISLNTVRKWWKKRSCGANDK